MIVYIGAVCPCCTLRVARALDTGSIHRNSGGCVQAVVYTKGTLAEAQQFDTFCRAQQPPVPFVYAKTVGVFGQVFCDFGPEFVITDTDGAPSRVLYLFMENRSAAPVYMQDSNCRLGSALYNADALIVRQPWVSIRPKS